MKTKYIVFTLLSIIIATTTALFFHACKKLDIKRVTKCTLENATVADATTVHVVLDVYD